MTNGWLGNMFLSSNEPTNLNLGENVVFAIMAWLDQNLIQLHSRFLQTFRTSIKTIASNTRLTTNSSVTLALSNVHKYLMPPSPSCLFKCCWSPQTSAMCSHHTWLKSKAFESLTVILKGKVVPLQVWSDPKGSRRLRFPYFATTA